MFSLIRFLLILVFCFLSVANSLENSAQVATPGKATNTEGHTEKTEVTCPAGEGSVWVPTDIRSSGKCT